MPIQRAYGRIKSQNTEDVPKVRFTDSHVKCFALKHGAPIVPPKVFDLRTILSLPEALDEIDQGRASSCTSNAIAFAFAVDEIKQKNADIFLPSRLFIYYNERLLEGTINSDSGAMISDGMKCISQYGVCDERHWIYDPTQFAVKPSDAAYQEAKSDKALKFANIDFSQDQTADARIAHLKTALRAGYPIIFGFTVYESFEGDAVAETGMMPMPDTTKEQVMGGHAVCCVGYDDNKQCFIVKNSWGLWGDKGYFYMPYQFAQDPNMTDEFWVLQQVANPTVPGFTSEDVDLEPDAKNLDVDLGSSGVVNTQ